MLAKALKKLYKKLIGTETTAYTAPKIILALAEDFEAELPAHTASDSGKVLAVKSDGTLEWKSLS